MTLMDWVQIVTLLLLILLLLKPLYSRWLPKNGAGCGTACCRRAR